MPADGICQRREIRALSVAPGYQDYVAAVLRQTLQGRQGGADVGSLGIVDPVDTVDRGHPFAAVRQPGKFACGLQHGVQRQVQRPAQRQAGQHVGQVVQAGNPEFGLPEQRLAAMDQPVLAVTVIHVEIGVRPRQRITDGPAPRALHGAHGFIIQVDDHGAVAGIDVLLGLRVVFHAFMAVQVIRRHVQDRRRGGPVGTQGLKLETGQFQHVIIRRRP